MPENSSNHDTLQRFTFDKHLVRGVLIHLKASYQKACESTSYSEQAKRFMGEALCAAGLLSSTIKFKGRLTLQVQGDGALSLLLAQVNEKLQLRGLALEKGELSKKLSDAIGKGRLLINIDPQGAKQRYQAVTEISGTSLATTIDHYFNQSEQLPTRLWLFADDNEAAGFLLQQLPSQGQLEHDEAEEHDYWEHLVTLAETLTKDELLGLSSVDVLHRLFHQETVRVYESEPVCFRCNCSTEKMEEALRKFDRNEIEDLFKKSAFVKVNCDFCNRSYQFDPVDVARIYSDGTQVPPNETKQ